ARLAQGSNLPGEGGGKLTQTMKLPDGKVLPAGTTFAAALEEVRKYSGREVAKTLPDFGLPQPPKGPTKEARQRRNARWKTVAAKWALDIKTLATLEVTRLGADAPGPGGGVGPVGIAGNAAFIAPGGGIQVVVRNNQQFIIRNGVWQPLAPPPIAQRPAAGVDEQITEVRPVGDRVLVSTSTGRLLSADAGTGRVAWQSRLSDRPLDRVVATEDFTVVRASDDVSIRLIALDTFTGQPLGPPKSFSPQM